MTGEPGVRSASAACSSGRIGSIIAVCEATSTFDPAGEPCSARSTAAITASTCVGRPGDHGLARRDVHRDRHLGVVGDQRLGGVGVEFQQRHRALSGQPRHQPRPRGDHLQALGRAQRPGHHRRGDLAHRMPDHRVGFHPVGAPQRGQRQLQADQHRLDLRRSRSPARRRRAPRAARTRPARRSPAPARRPPRRTPARRRAAAGPSRPTANPGRSRRTPCPDRTAPGAGRPRRARICPAASARSPATASSRSRAQTVANVGWCVRWWLRVWATSASGDLGAGAGHPVGQHARPSTRSARGSCPTTTSVVTAGCGAPAGAAAACGACSRPRGRWCRRSRTTTPRPGAVVRSSAMSSARRRPSAEARRTGCADWGSSKLLIRRDLAALHRQHGLDEAGDAGGGLEVAEVGLDRADQQRGVGLPSASVAPRPARGLRSGRRAACRCRAPRRSRPRAGSTPASAQAARNTAACAAGLGAIRPLDRPSWLTAEPRTTASTRSPSRSASESRLSTTTPQPSPRTKPSAAASKAWHAPVGDMRLGLVEAARRGRREQQVDAAGEGQRRTRPVRRLWQARCTATSDDEQAVSTVTDGPRRSKKYDSRLAMMLSAPPVPVQASTWLRSRDAR